ncbi:MAG: hypothetical protein ACYTEZ_17535 [Planctomycetota bacterium]
MDELRRRADAITARLLYSDEPLIDLEIAINELREYVRERWPDRVWLFESIYEARWRRLREQGWARERT